MSKSMLMFNGLNGSTGAPLTPPLTAERVARLALGEGLEAQQREELAHWSEIFRGFHYDLAFGIDPRNLESTGWGVVFPQEGQEDVLQALAPLLAHRREQAARRYRELHYEPQESKQKFLARYGAGSGPVNPDVLPYYLLIVGSPEEIPFSFQYQLDLQYAVGRIHFESVEAYARYAESVVAAEAGKIERARQATFFAVVHPDDELTSRSLRLLVEPLADHLVARWPEWAIERLSGEAATKIALGKVLARESGPALLFTSSHGLGFECGDARQLDHQGALVCREWPGPLGWREAIPEAHYFSGDDVLASPAGLVTFHFACYGAGTPSWDSFSEAQASRQRIAPRAFVGRLPQRLLSHPRGGALAVVGHVDRAWGYSFEWPQAGGHRAVFQSALERLLAGYPVGAAMECFNQRHAELATDLAREIEEAKYAASGKVDFMTLAELWTAHKDARSYVVLGDPAVRLAVS